MELCFIPVNLVVTTCRAAQAMASQLLWGVHKAVDPAVDKLGQLKLLPPLPALNI